MSLILIYIRCVYTHTRSNYIRRLICTYLFVVYLTALLACQAMQCIAHMSQKSFSTEEIIDNLRYTTHHRTKVVVDWLAFLMYSGDARYKSRSDDRLF